jgi:hypothetical protein
MAGSKPDPGKQFLRPYLKKKKKITKRAGRVTQTVREPPCKCKALSSNSRAEKINK